MNIPFQKALLPALITSALALSACGGSSDSTTTATGAKTLTTGIITGFGSVYVNGCKYDIDNASIDSDDVMGNGQSAQANLDIGMVVTVTGETRTDDQGNCTGTADKIIYDNDVEGPVAVGSLNITTDSTGAVIEVAVTILGQAVIINGDTRFKSEDGAAYGLDSVSEGDILEISGLLDANGAIVATRVEWQNEKQSSPATEDYELKGMITDLDTGTMSFLLKGMPISYSTDTDFDDMTSADLADGLYVEVKGVLNAAGDTLIADKIEAEDDGMEKGKEYHSEFEGVISNYDPDTMRFTLQGMTVDASDPNLKLKPSGLVLGDGLRVEVEGELMVADDGSATLMASEIKRKGDKIKIQATISAIDSESDPSATLLTLDVFGEAVSVRVNQQTEFENDLSEGMMYALGDFVEVEAYDDGSGVINAIELKVHEADDVELKGPVDGYDMTAMTVTLFGLSFDISRADMTMDHMMPPAADFWTSVDGQGHVKLVDEYPADGVIDKVEVEVD